MMGVLAIVLAVVRMVRRMGRLTLRHLGFVFRRWVSARNFVRPFE